MPIITKTKLFDYYNRGLLTQREFWKFRNEKRDQGKPEYKTTAGKRAILYKEIGDLAHYVGEFELDLGVRAILNGWDVALRRIKGGARKSREQAIKSEKKRRNNERFSNYINSGKKEKVNV